MKENQISKRKKERNKQTKCKKEIQLDFVHSAEWCFFMNDPRRRGGTSHLREEDMEKYRAKVWCSSPGCVTDNSEWKAAARNTELRGQTKLKTGLEYRLNKRKKTTNLKHAGLRGLVQSRCSLFDWWQVGIFTLPLCWWRDQSNQRKSIKVSYFWWVTSLVWFVSLA